MSNEGNLLSHFDMLLKVDFFWFQGRSSVLYAAAIRVGCCQVSLSESYGDVDGKKLRNANSAVQRVHRHAPAASGDF